MNKDKQAYYITKRFVVDAEDQLQAELLANWIGHRVLTDSECECYVAETLKVEIAQ